MRPLRVVLERNGRTESEHLVHGVVHESGSDTPAVFGEREITPFWRSSMKPFQAIAVARAGALERVGLGREALALACASHHGMTRHLDVVATVLAAVGRSESDLACGPHRPVHEASAEALDVAGRLPGRLHNNCSGKHAAMLALATAYEWPIEGYHQFSHPLQAHIRAELADWLTPDPEGLDWGVDGCGVPTPALPLDEMARAYARLGASADPVTRSVVSAMTEHPTLISGPDAFSANVMMATGGRVLGKEGAEGVFCLASSDAGWGAAFKVADGAMRAIGPAVVEGLAGLSLLTDEEVARLASFTRSSITNTRGEVVAELVGAVNEG